MLLVQFSHLSSGHAYEYWQMITAIELHRFGSSSLLVKSSSLGFGMLGTLSDRGTFTEASVFGSSLSWLGQKSHQSPNCQWAPTRIWNRFVHEGRATECLLCGRCALCFLKKELPWFSCTNLWRSSSPNRLSTRLAATVSQKGLCLGAICSRIARCSCQFEC